MLSWPHDDAFFFVSGKEREEEDSSLSLSLSFRRATSFTRFIKWSSMRRKLWGRIWAQTNGISNRATNRIKKKEKEEEEDEEEEKEDTIWRRRERRARA